MGNGYKGVAPRLDGKQKLYLELTGIPLGSEAYQNLCEWFVKGRSEPVGMVSCIRMQMSLIERVLPDMLETAELVEYLRSIFAGDKAILAELIIRRYGLDTESGGCRRVVDVALELSMEFNYTESTIRTMLPKAMAVLYRDEHFRNALKVPELSGGLLNYWKFLCILLTGMDRRVEQVDWDEKMAIVAAERLQNVGVKSLKVADMAVEAWLSTLPKEAQMATKMRYGLGYPAIRRSDNYIAMASGFSEDRNLMDYLATKLNRSSLCVLMGVEVSEVDYARMRAEMAFERTEQTDIRKLGLPEKVGSVLWGNVTETAGGLLGIDMYQEESHAWERYVPSKYWRDVVQLWIDLRIKLEIGEYKFEFDGKYAYQNVS